LKPETYEFAAFGVFMEIYYLFMDKSLLGIWANVKNIQYKQ